MRPIIKINNLKRDFHMGDETVHALRGIDLTICEGEFVTIWEPAVQGNQLS